MEFKEVLGKENYNIEEIKNDMGFKDNKELIKYIFSSFIKNINDVSTGKSSILSIANTELLLDVKAFYSYNALNVGTLEFLIRLFKEADKKLGDMFSKEKVKFMMQQIMFLPSYQAHIRKLQTQEEAPYFNKDGSQNMNRDITYDDCVRDGIIQLVSGRISCIVSQLMVVGQLFFIAIAKFIISHRLKIDLFIVLSIVSTVVIGE
jgi:hypothetical protein